MPRVTAGSKIQLSTKQALGVTASVSNNRNIIELNGQRYDAKTGRLVSDRIPGNDSNKIKPVAKVVDGFVRRKTPIIKPKNVRQHYKASASAKLHSKLSRSETLMRQTVNKPIKSADNNSDVPDFDIKHQSKLSIDPARKNRASKIAKSHLVSRFGNPFAQVNKKITHLTVQPMPSGKNAQQTPHGMSYPIDPRPQLNNQLKKDFDTALQKANSHNEPKIKKSPILHRTAAKLRITPRTLGILSGLTVIVFGVGIVLYSQASQLMVKVASTKAGINAKLPDYKPSGFSLDGPIRYSSNQITLLYNSNSDDRNFTITQKKSDWNSQALLDNYVKNSSPNYQTRQDKGKTIYIYGDNNATWVSGGIWYQVEGQSSLNSDQLLRIADSL